MTQPADGKRHPDHRRSRHRELLSLETRRAISRAVGRRDQYTESIPAGRLDTRRGQGHRQRAALGGALRRRTEGRARAPAADRWQRRGARPGYQGGTTRQPPPPSHTHMASRRPNVRRRRHTSRCLIDASHTRRRRRHSSVAAIAVTQSLTHGHSGGRARREERVGRTRPARRVPRVTPVTGRR